MKELTLIRTNDDGARTYGYLMIGKKKLFTLEEPWKNNAKGISCIPKGRYQIYRHNWGPPYTGQKQKDCFGLLAVPGRTGILIHTGNTVLDIEGCILVGLTTGKIKNKDGVTRDAVLSSRDALKLLKDFIGKDTTWYLSIE